MRGLLGGLAANTGDTPLARAQTILDQAFASDDPDDQVALARKALEISADCADAYVLLAENADSRAEALELYEKGVEAGTRALGPELFQEAAGSFWGVLETRPLMRAKFGVANTLWSLKRQAEAVEQVHEMLVLNPSDNQGVRYTLAAWLLQLNRDDDLARLLDHFADDGTAAWSYTRTLLAFRRHGDAPETRALCQQSRKLNRHIPSFLLGNKPLPRELPPSYIVGSIDEAIVYAAASLPGWKVTPGALTWLKNQEKRPLKDRPTAAKAKGPSDKSKAQLEKMPQEFDVWQADIRQVPHWIRVAGEPIRPWVLLVTSATHDQVLMYGLSDDEPEPDELWDTLARAIKKPMSGEPHRPSLLEFLPDGPVETLVPQIEALGIICEAAEDLDQLSTVFESLAEHMAGSGPPGLLEMPGIEPPHVAGFYHAAASYYRRAPWRTFGDDEAIKIECSQFQSGPWYGVIMGQSGVTIGLALYDDLNVLRQLWDDDLSDEDNARETVALAVTFDDETEVSARDLEASREHGWEIAGPDAYPSIYRKERGMSIRPPLAWELQLMEACLRSLPKFVTRNPPDGDPEPQAMSVPTSSGTLELVLSWVLE